MNQRGFAIPSPTLIMAGVIIALSLSNVILFNLYSGAKDDLSAYKSSVATQMEVVRIENEKRLAAVESVAKDAADKWDRARAALDARPRVRVSNNCGEGKMPSLSPASTKVEGLQASGGESWITSDQCERIANDSTLDREWIETVKQLTDNWHEASK